MRIRLLVSILGLCVAGSVSGQDAVPAAAPAAEAPPVAPAIVDDGPVKPGDATAGQAKAAVCAACHGLDGNAADPINPKIAGQHERYIARQLELFKNGGRVNAVMVAFALPLSRQDMRDIGAYFATQTALPGVANDTPIKSGEPETWAQRGQRLYSGGDAVRGLPACKACHGVSGRGNPGPAYPSLVGQHADYTKAKLLAFRNAERWGGADDATGLIMVQIARQLDDTEIEALATYIEGLYDTTAVPEQRSADAR
jgi:cytochrome c553